MDIALADAGENDHRTKTNSGKYKRTAQNARWIQIQHSSCRWPKDEVAWLLAVIAASTASFYVVQGSDPGYVTEDILRAMDVEGGGLLGDCAADDSAEAQKQQREIEYRRRKIELMEKALAADDAPPDGLPVEAASSMEFCSTCALQPPLRAYHCAYCDRCVATFDHHCFFIGTCVGERNHCRFWWFLVLSSVEVATCLSIIHSGFRAEASLKQWLHSNGMALASAMFFWFFAFMAFGLCGFHTFLMLTNSNTREVGKGPEKLAYLHGTRECDLPFSNGACHNLRGFCCFRPGFGAKVWTPHAWKPVGRIDRNSENICDNLWENKYYSCC